MYVKLQIYNDLQQPNIQNMLKLSLLSKLNFISDHNVPAFLDFEYLDKKRNLESKSKYKTSHVAH